MKAKLYVALTASIAFLLSVGAQAGPQGSLLKELGLNEFPGSKQLTEITLPPGKLLDSIAKEFGPQLGLSDVTQASILIYRIDPSIESQRVYGFFLPGVTAQGWKSLVSSFEKDDGMAVLYNAKVGMLVFSIDAPGDRDRQMTIVRVLGKIDLNRTAEKNNLTDRIRLWMGGGFGPENKSVGQITSVSKLPVSQPISIPPSKWLHIKTTGSAVRAHFADQNTTELRVQSKSDDAGELVRTDEGLILVVAPGTRVQDATLPTNVQKILQLNDGSLAIQGGRPGQLMVTSISAPVTLDAVSMNDGELIIRASSSDVSLGFSEVKGGKLDIDAAFGSNVTLVLPKDASVRIVIDAPAANTHNLTGAEPHATGDRTNLVLGAGGALFHVQVSKGSVTVKTAN